MDDQNNFYIKVKKLYNSKRLELIKVHRKENKPIIERQLIEVINTLAELLNEPKIDPENISATLRAYPNLYGE